MNYNFSDKISTVKPSAIREILKATADPDIISFAAGNPAPEAFPTQEIAEISASILQNNPISALQYSITEGYPQLRTLLKNDLKNNYNIGTSEDDLIVVSGAQQGIDLFGRVFINDGDVVICESPSFVGALNSFKSNGAKLAGVPIESDGINPNILEQTIKNNKNVKFLYIIPNFQNPTGITTSLKKRKEIYDVCLRNNVMILEDNPYGDLRFNGDDIPSIKSIDTHGIVIYCGSFSKILSPGLRVGHLTANKSIINRLVVAKQCNDVHTNIWSQMICYEFMVNYNFKSHLNRLKDIYRHKAILMLECIDSQFSNKVAHTIPDGGLFIWCTAPIATDISNLAKKTIEKNVAFVPGIAFLPYDTEPSSSFRLNFSTPTDDEIIKGIKILGNVTKTL